MVTIPCYDTPIKTTRTVYPEDPMRVKYALIELGESIRRTITVREELEPAIKSKKDRVACAHVGT